MNTSSSPSLKMAVTAYAKYAFGIREVSKQCENINCSGHGFCQDGQCICLIQFTGGTCQDANIGYFMAFGSIFMTLCFVALIQLLLCISNEYQRQKRKSLRSALSVTGPKLLYVLTILATGVRGLYFFARWHMSDLAASHLWSVYYPILLSGSSLIVCFWAEAFHLDNIDCEKPRFLSKSIIGFSLLNFVLFTLLVIQLVATELTDQVLSDYIYKVCNGAVAGLLILDVVFFLVYGVQVYFKVHGAFKKSQNNVDPWQLHMSRLGLIAQASLQLFTALFLMSDVMKEQWKSRLPVLDQNFIDIGFRIVEFGVVLWFPCVLWNCKSPESLWVLNPQILFLKTFKIENKEEDHTTVAVPNYGAINDDGMKQDCWICYDRERTDAGPLIHPCQCKGDVSAVHHECLRKWLIECPSEDDGFKCKVCNNQYKLKESWIFTPRYIQPRHWFQTFLSLVVMVGCPFGTYTMIHSVATETYIDVLTIGVCILIELGCVRLLVVSLGICYKRGRLSTVKIQEPIVQTVVKASQLQSNICESRENVDIAPNDAACSVSVEAVIESK